MNYSRDKKGWVTFKGNRKKVKLRAYISDLAQKITHLGSNPFKYNRDKLIYSYNKDGIKGVNIGAKILIDEIIEEKHNELDKKLVNEGHTH